MVWLYRSAAQAEAHQEQLQTQLQTLIAGYESQISEIQKTLEENERAAALSQVRYTTDQTDEESLIQLVKDTITSAGIQIQYTEKAEKSRTKALLASVSDARDKDSFDSAFVTLDPEYRDFVVPEEWTFLQAAGGFGGLIFYGYELEGTAIPESNLLKYFIADGVYDFDVSELSDFHVTEGLGSIFVDADQSEFDVNFEVAFDSKGHGKYVALVGNVNGGYRVLDVVEEDKVSTVVEQNGNVGTQEQGYVSTFNGDSSVVDSDPAAEDTNQGGNSGGSNGGYNPNTDDDPYNDDPNYDPSKDNYDPDAVGTGNSNDPFWGDPGYEGPKEGYSYVPGYGYVSDTPVDRPVYGNDPDIGTTDLPSNEEYDAAGGVHHGY